MQVRRLASQTIVWVRSKTGTCTSCSYLEKICVRQVYVYFKVGLYKVLCTLLSNSNHTVTIYIAQNPRLNALSLDWGLYPLSRFGQEHPRTQGYL